MQIGKPFIKWRWNYPSRTNAFINIMVIIRSWYGMDNKDEYTSQTKINKKSVCIQIVELAYVEVLLIY